MPIIEVTDLTRKYGDHTAVDAISFTVERGSLFAFLGPNGAGKSTTITVLTTLAKPQGGTVVYSIIDQDPRLLGQDDADIRSRIGVVFQESLLDRPLTVRANLGMRAHLYGRREVGDIARTLRLHDILDQRYGTLSGGQRRRVDIARALLARPEILFLDEPTTGLDPQSRHLVWETIQSLREELGLTVFLTTHDMEEAEQADAVTIIDHGKVIAAGTPAQLRTAYSSDHLTLRGTPGLADALTAAGTAWTRADDIIDIALPSSIDALGILNAQADLITDFEVAHGTMNDVFLTLTGTNLRED